MRHRLVASTLATLVVALAAFTGTSLAGNGNGNGGSSNGHSDTSKQSDTTPASPATGGSNSQGVKPSSTTKHDTYAKASSDKTKKYGNGQTAGQIATKAGYGDATLHGPGNSQPHKTSCGPHEVDVHALKHKACGETSKASAPKSKPEHADHASKPAEKREHATPKAVATPAPKMAHVTICHATGSSTNPYVRISPSVSGVFHGHMGHQDGRDIIPAFTYEGHTYSLNWDAAGQALYNAGCAAPTAQAQVAGAEETKTAAAPCATTTQTVTEQVLVGVKHFTGPKGSGRYVVIHPSTHSAHYTGKHPDDVPLYETVTKTVTVPAADCSSTETKTETKTESQTVTTQTATTAPTAVVQGTQTAPRAATGVGAVKGVSIALKPTAKPKPRGGVLGTTTRLGSTVTSAHLPFTGLPLWIFVAVAAGRILIGAAVRRSADTRI